jgi:hypothetical protein
MTDQLLERLPRTAANIEAAYSNAYPIILYYIKIWHIIAHVRLQIMKYIDTSTDISLQVATYNSIDWTWNVFQYDW